VTDDIAYPSVELILGLHEQIVAEGDITEPGVRKHYLKFRPECWVRNSASVLFEARVMYYSQCQP